MNFRNLVPSSINLVKRRYKLIEITSNQSKAINSIEASQNQNRNISDSSYVSSELNPATQQARSINEYANPPKAKPETIYENYNNTIEEESSIEFKNEINNPYNKIKEDLYINPQWIDNVNVTVANLAEETLEEIERIRVTRGFFSDEMKQTIWKVLKLYKTVAKDQTDKSINVQNNPNPRHLRPNPVESSELSLAVNNTICSLAQKAKGELDVLGNAPYAQNSRRVIGSLLSSYYHLMETHYDCFSESNIVTMLQRISSLSNRAGQNNWTLRYHTEFMNKLLYYVRIRINKFDAHDYAMLIWSLGRLGPLLRTFIIDHQPFDKFIQGLLEASQKEFPRMTTNDALNILLGLSQTGISQMIIGPYIRGLIQILDLKLYEFSPEDIASIIWAFSRMQYNNDTNFLNKLCSIAENKMSKFDIYTLSSFLRGLTLLDHMGTPTMNKKALEEIEKRIDEFDLTNLSRVTWALILLHQHPHGIVLDTLSKKFLESKDVNSNTVCSFILAYSHAGEIHPEVLTELKRHFTKHASSYRHHEVSKFLWSLVSLQELDENIMAAVENTSYATLSPMRHGLDGIRQLCQVLISWRLEYKKMTPSFVTRELEQAAYSSWRVTQKANAPFGIVNEILSYFSSAGFDCKSPWLIETAPISATCVILHQGIVSKEINAVIEVISQSQYYANRPDVLKPRARWRNNILRALGWSVLHVYLREWKKLGSKKAKAEFLQNLVLKECNEKINFYAIPNLAEEDGSQIENVSFLRAHEQKIKYNDNIKVEEMTQNDDNIKVEEVTQNDDNIKVERDAILEFDFTGLVDHVKSDEEKIEMKEAREAESNIQTDDEIIGEEQINLKEDQGLVVKEKEFKDDEFDDDDELNKARETNFVPREYGRFLVFSEDDSEHEDYEEPIKKKNTNKITSKPKSSDEEELYSEEEIRSDEDDPFKRMSEEESKMKRRHNNMNKIDIKRQEERYVVESDIEKCEINTKNSEMETSATENELETMLDSDEKKKIKNEFENYLDSDLKSENDVNENDVTFRYKNHDSMPDEMTRHDNEILRQNSNNKMSNHWADPNLEGFFDDLTAPATVRGRQGRERELKKP